MHPPLRAVLASLALPLAMMVVTGTAAALFQGSECTAREYHTLRNTTRSGSPTYLAELREALRSGHLTRWQYTGLMRSFWETDNYGLKVDLAAAGTEEERAALVQEIGLPTFSDGRVAIPR